MKILIERKRLIAAVTLLLACIVMAVLPFFALRAVKADSNDYGDDDTLPNFYYFSDYENCVEYYEALWQAGDFEDHELYQLSQQTPYTDLLYYYEHGYFYDIENAYVIVECRGGMQRKYDLSVNSCCDLLCDIFQTLKSNNCKIMFINGTDEMKFASNSYFLSLADIHVNVDMFSVFITSIIKTACVDCRSYKLQNCTFLLDESFFIDSQGYTGYGDGMFLSYFIPFFKNAYKDVLMGCGMYSLREIMSDEHINVNVIIHLGGNTYYDLVANGTFVCNSLDDLYENHLYNNYIYTIGATWSGIDYIYEWYDNVSYIKDTYEGSLGVGHIKNFIYYYGAQSSEYGFSGVFGCNSTMDNILEIMADFVFDGNIVQYDNYDGVCDISHKDCATSGNGWMEVLLGSEFEDMLAIDVVAFEGLQESDPEYYAYLNAGLDDTL